MGIRLINNKNISFLSFKLNLSFIFFMRIQIKKKKGTNIPICLNKNIIGYLKLSKILELSKPVRFNPYDIVTKSLLKSQIK